ncbi:hypothetical protein DY000_02055870 [Brassica cretica]|uniref:Uncharacterized protein n=1 Tax=Brassica cretica TaxID=69181 RepID=A0ABQ7ABP5_BRACR|nr:hypothetical protein DY000_02055870 [Brassica cretica]
MLILGTMNATRSHTYRPYLSEGSIYSLSGFEVTQSNNNFRLSDAPACPHSLQRWHNIRRTYDQLLALANHQTTTITISDGIHRSQRVMLTLRVERGLNEIAYGPPTTFRRNSDGCKAVRRNSVGIVQSQTAIQRSYIFVGNGHMVRRKFVGKFRRNSDDFTVNRNVVGNSSEYTDELPTTTTVTFFIGMSSENSDDPCFVGIPSEMADGIPTTSTFWIWSEIGW